MTKFGLVTKFKVNISLQLIYYAFQFAQSNRLPIIIVCFLLKESYDSNHIFSNNDLKQLLILKELFDIIKSCNLRDL